MIRTRVEVSGQVADFVRSLAPEPRRRLRQAIRNLQHFRGDIRSLEGELQGFYRLRALTYRIIFSSEMDGETRLIRCVHAAPRTLVYEVFAQRLREFLDR